MKKYEKKDSFWDTLPRPFFALAPMADVTDTSFRTMFAKYGKPDVFWTEFVSADGLCSPGRESLKIDLLFEENQRPIVAQLFTSDPKNMYKAGMLVKELGFDGLDINMGCPDRKIEKQGCGCDMIRNPKAATTIIEAAMQTGLPVSVKTRMGYNQDEIDSWIPTLLQTNIVALSVHLRTRKEMSKVPAHWEAMSRIVALRDTLAPKTLLVGNGDVMDRADGEQKAQESGCDGIMIGRGMFGNPWLFNKKVSRSAVPIKKQLRVMVEHTKLFEEKLPTKSFNLMKKHYKAYIEGFVGAKQLRMKLMDEAQNATDVEQIVDAFLQQ